MLSNSTTAPAASTSNNNISSSSSANGSSSAPAANSNSSSGSASTNNATAQSSTDNTTPANPPIVYTERQMKSKRLFPRWNKKFSNFSCSFFPALNPKLDRYLIFRIRIVLIVIMLLKSNKFDIIYCFVTNITELFKLISRWTASLFEAS